MTLNITGPKTPPRLDTEVPRLSRRGSEESRCPERRLRKVRLPGRVLQPVLRTDLIPTLSSTFTISLNLSILPGLRGSLGRVTSMRGPDKNPRYN